MLHVLCGSVSEGPVLTCHSPLPGGPGPRRGPAVARGFSRRRAGRRGLCWQVGGVTRGRQQPESRGVLPATQRPELSACGHLAASLTSQQVLLGTAGTEWVPALACYWNEWREGASRWADGSASSLQARVLRGRGHWPATPACRVLTAHSSAWSLLPPTSPDSSLLCCRTPTSAAVTSVFCPVEAGARPQA